MVAYAAQVVHSIITSRWTAQGVLPILAPASTVHIQLIANLSSRATEHTNYVWHFQTAAGYEHGCSCLNLLKYINKNFDQTCSGKGRWRLDTAHRHDLRLIPAASESAHNPSRREVGQELEIETMVQMNKDIEAHCSFACSGTQTSCILEWQLDAGTGLTIKVSARG